jgi:hypothetical protein
MTKIWPYLAGVCACVSCSDQEHVKTNVLALSFALHLHVGWQPSGPARLTGVSALFL